MPDFYVIYSNTNSKPIKTINFTFLAGFMRFLKIFKYNCSISIKKSVFCPTFSCFSAK